jgi:16S rRNA (cytosine1402-N4)-methyltransferase
VLESLKIKPNGIYADFTLGRAGHSREIAARLGEGGLLIGVDRDSAAIEAGRERLAEFGDKVMLIRSDLRNAAERIREAGIDKLDGVLMDLGVSSPQLDDARRGFSYMKDAPLDMRMDLSAPLSAREVINGESEEELERILREYGEERYSARIARAIVAARPIETTLELVDVIKSAMPAAALREKQHPAKRSFQAIRIAVNDELGALEDGLKGAADMLAVGGRLAVITFHSLEDRIAKEFIAERSKGCTCPPDFPVCVCGKTPEFKATPRKPIVPSKKELDENPRSRSSKLRVAEKLK